MISAFFSFIISLIVLAVILGGYLIAGWFGAGSVIANHQNKATCKKCGYTFVYRTSSEIAQMKRSAFIRLLICGGLVVACATFMMAVFI